MAVEKSTVLDDLKVMIGPAAEQQLPVLQLLISQTEAQLRLKLRKTALEAIPDELSFIVTDVAMRRFNRRGDEGKSASSQAGLSTTWSTGDFDDYAADIADWLDQQDQHRSLGHGGFYNAYGGGRR